MKDMKNVKIHISIKMQMSKIKGSGNLDGS